MNKNILTIFAVVCAVIVGIHVSISVLTGGSNEIGKLALYLSGACFVIGLVKPKLGMFLLLALAGYSDLIKRFMVLGSGISQLDLVYVLAMAPMVLAGAALNLFATRTAIGKARKGDWVRFLLSTAVFALVGSGALVNGGSLKSMRGVVDYGAFIYLLYVLPIIFPTKEELLRYAKTALVVFIPVALYGIWQRIFGLADFEMDYLATGLSIETRQLGKIGLRPFSTLNAASSLTIVMAACAMLTSLLMKVRMLNVVFGFILLGLFTTACIMTFTRTGWVCLGLAPFIIVALRYRLTTLSGYALALVISLGVIINAEWFLHNLQGWQADISGEGDYGRSTQAFKVTTLYDRFLGFSNLKNPDNWEPFGLDLSKSTAASKYDDPSFSHDLISRFIFKRGYIPAAFIALFGIGFAVYLHSRILSQTMKLRKLTTIAAGACGALLVSVAAGTYAFQFPANIFLWILVCLTLSYLNDREPVVAAENHE